MGVIAYINSSLELWSCLISFIVVVCLIITRKTKDRIGFLYFGMLLCNIGSQFFDAMALFFRGHIGIYNYIGVRISNFLSYTFNFILMAIFMSFLYQNIKEKKEINYRIVKIGWAISILSIITLVVSQFYPIFYYIDSLNVYHRAPLFFISQCSGVCSLGICLYLIIKYWNFLVIQQKITYLIYVFSPIVALIIQIYAYGIVFVNLVNTISLVIIFIFLQEEQSKKQLEYENLISQSKISIMLSQIQPHFIYNALNTIHYLCRTNPKKASEVVENFSYYLRGNLDSLSNCDCITLDKELEHLECYLEIETLRFPKINVKYSLNSTNFFIPPLSIQPLVENSIRYGINQRESGEGTVYIKTFEDSCYHYIEINDNGVGFDPREVQYDGRSHIGIDNTKQRIESMCNGSLEIISKKNIGTKITIKIPKE